MKCSFLCVRERFVYGLLPLQHQLCFRPLLDKIGSLVVHFFPAKEQKNLCEIRVKYQLRIASKYS